MIILEVLNSQPLPQVGGHCLETSTRAGMGTGHRQDELGRVGWLGGGMVLGSGRCLGSVGGGRWIWVKIGCS